MSPACFAPDQFFDLAALRESGHAALLDGCEAVWEIIPRIRPYLAELLQRQAPEDRSEHLGKPYIGEQVYIGEGTTVEHGAMIKGPAWIGPGCQIRHGAYVRDNAIIGAGSVIGNSCEVKNSFLLGHAEVPHFNYVGDSVLGFKAHLGAGAILSNVRLDRGEINVVPDPAGYSAEDLPRRLPTGLRKFGAILGDVVEVGCNAVLSPGTILGPSCLVYPNAHYRGALPARRIVKLRQEQLIVERGE